MKALTTLGNGSTWTVLALSLVCGGGLAAQLGLRIGAAATLSLAASFPLKRMCSRARPSQVVVGLFPLAKDPDGFSFPSGHTCAAFSVAMAVGPLALGPPGALTALATIMAAGIGFSRVYLGAHFPLDVLAGGMIGSALGLFTRLLFA
jgi:undecaprenyl-diphosphatase